MSTYETYSLKLFKGEENYYYQSRPIQASSSPCSFYDAIRYFETRRTIPKCFISAIKSVRVKRSEYFRECRRRTSHSAILDELLCSCLHFRDGGALTSPEELRSSRGALDRIVVKTIRNALDIQHTWVKLQDVSLRVKLGSSAQATATQCSTTLTIRLSSLIV